MSLASDLTIIFQDLTGKTAAVKATEIANAILLSAYPIGSFYVQYPNANSSTLTTAFPDAYAPTALFGGTWVKQWDTENVFFRTEGTDYQTRTNGLSLDEMQGHLHYRNVNHTIEYILDTGEGTRDWIIGSEPFSASDVTGEATTEGTYGIPRKGSVTEPRNRLVRIWKRTA